MFPNSQQRHEVVVVVINQDLSKISTATFLAKNIRDITQNDSHCIHFYCTHMLAEANVDINWDTWDCR